MMSLTAFADELEREKARQRTYDAMMRKAKAGHVTGGRVFGYDNVEILGPDGQRSHVERRINEAEAAVVRRIFELSCRRRRPDAHHEGAQRRRRAGAAAAAGPAGGHGRRRRCARCCYGRSTAARSSGTRRGSATAGARSTSGRARQPNGLRWPRRASRSCRRAVASGQCAAPSGGAILERWSRIAHRRTCCQASPGARSVAAGSRLTAARTRRQARVHFYACTAHWKRGRDVCSNGWSAGWRLSTLKSWRRSRRHLAAVGHREAVALALEESQPERRDGAERNSRSRWPRSTSSAND